MQMIDLLKAQHIGVREFKENISKYLKRSKPSIVTITGEPKQAIVPYADMLELLEIVEELQDGRLRKEIRDARAAYRETRRGVPAKRIWEKYR